MAPIISLICAVISVVVIYIALKALADSRKMKKRTEDEEKSLRF